ncbi:DUF177 domain containing protein [Sulfitobacter noctilucicola]|uniref:Uncharacterized metal-binding protein YceD (DUF177 family) n=1 Tax=Sulfitobacter noctilucicola TaxID=1342301 RepID=A0A7W6M7R5_9RHOB|nr:DUF177 domain-containing protein [Sulfitobacter noctilucicola]KIN64843.1 DUF177 domain containing protein [Sulfitobacter noctilucicola]MBB4174013.1 uncharacterized metal-binding protein YceD (DUF177 family) [Sulfitobacter noctilucicola]
MAQPSPSRTAIRVSTLSQTAENAFSLRPDDAQINAIAQELDLSALRKLSFQGRIKPLGSSDWVLEGRLGATVVQPCVVTLDPVTTRIDTDVVRQFIREYEDPDEPEAEMTVEENVEPLGTWIDPAVVMMEALVLAVPDYPRKDEAELGQLVYTKPGEAPMTDEDARPFAGLAAIRDKLSKDDT